MCSYRATCAPCHLEKPCWQARRQQGEGLRSSLGHQLVGRTPIDMMRSFGRWAAGASEAEAVGPPMGLLECQCCCTTLLAHRMLGRVFPWRRDGVCRARGDCACRLLGSARPSVRDPSTVGNASTFSGGLEGWSGGWWRTRPLASEDVEFMRCRRKCSSRSGPCCLRWASTSCRTVVLVWRISLSARRSSFPQAFCIMVGAA